MAVLNIRNLPDDVHAKLRIRAARAGRSMEAEAREILAKACLKESAKQVHENLQDWVENLYGSQKPKGVVDDLIAERRRESRNE